MSLKTFTASYIETAFWAETAYGAPEDDGSGTWDTSWQSYGMDRDDLSPELLAKIEEDCRGFYEAFSDRWEDDAQAGHDFWLTRNRHGAGFWDGDYPEHGDFLTEMSHPYGEVYLYLGDDGLIYGSTRGKKSVHMPVARTLSEEEIIREEYRLRNLPENEELADDDPTGDTRVGKVTK